MGSNQSKPLPPSPCTIRRHGGTARLCNNLLRPLLNPPTSNLQRPHLSPPTNNQSLRSNLQRPRLTPPTISPLSLRLRLRPTRSRKPLHTTTENRKLIPEINFLSHTKCDSSSDLTNPLQMYEILTIDPMLGIK